MQARLDAKAEAKVAALRDWLTQRAARTQVRWPPGILNGEHGKPKGMHWRTFKRLCGEREYWQTAAMGFMAQKLGMSVPESWDELLV